MVLCQARPFPVEECHEFATSFFVVIPCGALYIIRIGSFNAARTSAQQRGIIQVFNKQEISTENGQKYSVQELAKLMMETETQNENSDASDLEEFCDSTSDVLLE